MSIISCFPVDATVSLEMDTVTGNEGDTVEVCVEVALSLGGILQTDLVVTLNATDGKAGKQIITIPR